MEEDLWLYELRQKKRAARILGNKYLSMESTIRRSYEDLLHQKPPEPEQTSSLQQELSDYRHDLDELSREKSEAARLFFRYHEEIKAYLRKQPSLP